MKAQVIYNQTKSKEQIQILYDENERQRIINVDLLASNKIGPQGLKGDSAYTVAKKNGFQGTEEQWLASLKGERGEPGPQGEKGQKGDRGEIGPRGAQGQIGPQGIQGIQGQIGPQGPQGIQGERGQTGPQGQRGPQGEQGIQGEKGDTGEPGSKGDKGEVGQQGPKGDTGQPGEDGKSAYEYAIDGGYDGTEEDFSKKLATNMAEMSAIEFGSLLPDGTLIDTPLNAATASEMADHTKIYVYTGNESGYINGNWYYWNGTSWVSGGKYNVNIVVDPPVQDVQVNSISVLTNGVANVPIASANTPGVVEIYPTYGVGIINNKLMINSASSEDIKQGNISTKPISAYKQHESVFYGLAKVSGDTTQINSNNAVGTYTDEAKASIKSMLGIEEPDYPVTDVQVDGSSIVSNGVATIPLMGTHILGVAQVNSGSYGVGVTQGRYLYLHTADNTIAKAGTHQYRPLTPFIQHASTFYGLAKAAGADEKDSTLAVGTYTDTAKGAIQKMLGMDGILGTDESDLTASKAYAVGDVFIANGKMYKVTTAIAADGAIVTEGAGQNAEEITVADNFVKKDDYASSTDAGVVKVNINKGIYLLNDNTLTLTAASDAQTKEGTNANYAVRISKQHVSTFYGLAKAAGDTTQSQSSNAVGTYTPEAKAAIKQMLGVSDLSTDITVSGTEPTITALANTRYLCGEVTSIDFTPSATGICEVIFTSGSAVALLTLPSTVKMPEWFDATALETDTIYDISIVDGVYGAVMTWQA